MNRIPSSTSLSRRAGPRSPIPTDNQLIQCLEPTAAHPCGAARRESVGRARLPPRLTARKLFHLSLGLAVFVLGGAVVRYRSFRLPDGEVTALLRSVHDVSRLGGWPDESRSRSASFGTYGFACLPQ